MNIRIIAKIASRIALVLGILAVASCFFSNMLFYGMLCSILGTLISISVIFIRTHYAVPTKWNHISYISVVLCSAPVIYVMILLFVLKHP
ncbi:MAG TPA: hypothetical protein VNZ49_04495 [Bacteroidia bacterium]|nr:hypothetical protein [Bacteroidia bacterium]